MRLGLFFLFFVVSIQCFSQEKSGIVFDKKTKERIARVNVINKSTGQSVYNNLQGEYKINAKKGDLLIFNRPDYFNDTIKVLSDTAVAVYMKPVAIQLKQVNVYGKLLTPEDRLEATKRDYTKIYGSDGNRDLLSMSPGSGVGVSIDALYNMFSRSGRNAERLQQTIQQDYYQNVIDYRFNRAFVGRITGLKDARLTDFMLKYRPGYYLVTSASEYELITSIRNNLRRYLRNPGAYSLTPLFGQ